jgi:thiol:disulfide interchange protein DsbD
VVAAAQHFLMVQVDVTRSGNPLHDRLLRQYEVKGVPTLLLLDGTGRERRDLRVVDYLPAAELLRRMAVVSGAS